MKNIFARSLRGVFFILTLLLTVSFCRANGLDFLSVGLRGGPSFNAPSRRFDQVEAFADYDLPWQWKFYSDWRLQPRLDVSGGWLNGDDTTAFVSSAGPILELRHAKFPLAIEAGFSPTFISRARYGDTNLGNRLQFTSHIGLEWYLTEHISAGIRFQHMSNGGLGHPNPGLNSEMLALSYHF